MSGPERGLYSGESPGEFETIARLLRPLANGHPAALDLLDDAAVLPGRPGFDLVISKDAMVAGVHFLDSDPLDVAARRLLRTNLSDLAAKAAEPFGYFLSIAWPRDAGWPERQAFAAGLAQDGRLFGLSLLGGDTVSTPGPLSISATILGWVPAGRMVRRSGAKPGDRLLVSGVIGDGWLGLQAARGALPDPDGYLSERYRRPEPRLTLRAALLAHASASADVSDGLLADAGHIATASGCAVSIDLNAIPLSPPARDWLEAAPKQTAALIALATGGDDYEVVCAAPPHSVAELIEQAGREGMMLTDIGGFAQGQGVSATHDGVAVALPRLGYRHGV
jgi:thiamine-monophosphate kinase